MKYKSHQTSYARKYQSYIQSILKQHKKTRTIIGDDEYPQHHFVSFPQVLANLREVNVTNKISKIVKLLPLVSKLVTKKQYSSKCFISGGITMAMLMTEWIQPEIDERIILTQKFGGSCRTCHWQLTYEFDEWGQNKPHLNTGNNFHIPHVDSVAPDQSVYLHSQT